MSVQDAPLRVGAPWCGGGDAMIPSSADRPQMLVEEFEELARTGPESVKLEFISGKLGVRPVPDQKHRAIVMWLLERCMQQRPDARLYPELQLKVEYYRRGRAIADGVLAPVDHFIEQGEWAEPEGVLMAVEVTSYDADTDQRDRRDTRDGYAAAGIPVYLLVDRDAYSVSVYCDPAKETYRKRLTYAFGEVVELPAPVGITLETEKLKNYVH